jgi:N-methylhydantoinase A/oxoprolinase/acetone carboxylase beta subunit
VLIDPALGSQIAAVDDRAALGERQFFAGPAIVKQPDTTILVPSGWHCRVAVSGILLLEPIATATR